VLYHRFEKIDIYPQDPPELLRALADIRDIDTKAKDKNEFERQCSALIVLQGLKLGFSYQG
jgi:hypothetical protein